MRDERAGVNPRSACPLPDALQHAGKQVKGTSDPQPSADDCRLPTTLNASEQKRREMTASTFLDITATRCAEAQQGASKRRNQKAGPPYSPVKPPTWLIGTSRGAGRLLRQRSSQMSYRSPGSSEARYIFAP